MIILNRYKIQGTIVGDCETCGEHKDLVCYEDILEPEKVVHKNCRECIKNRIGIKVEVRVK